MLTSLQIRNFAIIDEVDVELAGGMSVLTGETGAGKSILVDALGLVLGERGGTGLVRSGAPRAEFTARFELQDQEDASHWLAEQMLDLDGECILRRVINADGRSRAFINGNAVPLQSLKTLGEMLVDIHGQHFHQSLGRSDIQRDILDHFGGLLKLRDATGSAWSRWQEVQKQLDELQSANDDRVARLELLRFQAGEFAALGLESGELASLSVEREKLQHSGQLLEGVSRSLDALYDADAANAQALLADAARSIGELSSIDGALGDVATLLQEAEIQLSEAVDGLRRYADALDLDPERQNIVEERLDTIYALARKHRVEPEDLAAQQDVIARQLDDLENADMRSAELEQEAADLNAEYFAQAKKLSAGRRKSAARFAKEVTAAMTSLGMPGGAFEVAIDDRDAEDPRAWGLDDVTFLISANPGQEPKPLAKIASGGELSRMSLAIQVIGSDGSRIPTMVFDEVDSGVGGGIAEMVGLRLKELGVTRQVLCVTHLPQVASLGDHHFRVMKISDGSSTRTGIAELGNEERVEEIARMLGGVEITRRTLDHAEEMLQAGRSADAVNIPA